MTRLLLISSWVARDRVGLSAMWPALAVAGHDVLSIPTVVLSNHPGHAHVSGRTTPIAELEALCEAHRANGWHQNVAVAVTGYLPTADHVRFAAETIEDLRSHAARVLYVCDPVLGDSPKGLYVPESAARAIRDELVPLADVVTPNAFELSWLARQSIASADDARGAALSLGRPAVVVTSAPCEPETVGSLLVTPDGEHSRVAPRLDGVPHGTGDLFSGVLAGALASGHSVRRAFEHAADAVDAAVRASVGSDILHIPRTTSETPSD
ncbi:MAG: pyridoxal kinase [Hyphomicrobium sp.]|nr:pyridoxal kinase [Hyphomicrobium sp.]